MQDCLRGARPMATEPPEESEDGKAISMAKGGRWTGTVGKAGECDAHMPHFPRLSRHWRAGCGESCKSGSGGGGWKSARQRVTRWPPTSPRPKRAANYPEVATRSNRHGTC